jgi:hypothetical protein
VVVIVCVIGGYFPRDERIRFAAEGIIARTRKYILAEIRYARGMDHCYKQHHTKCIIILKVEK